MSDLLSFESEQNMKVKKLWIECKEKAQGNKLFAIELLQRILKEKEKEEVRKNEMQIL